MGQVQGIRDSALAFLVREIQVRQSKLLAIGQQSKKIAGILAAGNN